MMRQILLTLTNRFVLLYDADDSGKKAYWRDKKFFEENGCEVKFGRHPDGVKDTGTIADLLYAGDDFNREFIEMYYKMELYNITGSMEVRR